MSEAALSCVLHCGLVVLMACAACVRDSRNIHAVSGDPERTPSGVSARSWPLCPLLGPSASNRGVYGGDLGFSVPDPTREDRLAMLFGDTWAKPIDACHYPVMTSDDLQASLPARRPSTLSAGVPRGDEVSACKTLQYATPDPDDVTSWPRIRLFPSRVAQTRDAIMDTGSLRTPVAAFSDGKQLFTVIGRNDPVYCALSKDCPAAMSCTHDPDYAGKKLGICGRSAQAAPIYCRNDDDCLPTVGCTPPERGLCLADAPFSLHTPSGDVSPTWYHDDPRAAVANTLYIAAAVWPDRPSDYAVIHRFATQRFINVTARTVKHFDPRHPDENDYRPGHETLLMWGRAAFVSRGGAQSLPFLLYAPLKDLLGSDGSPGRFEPHFFAGYESNGLPRWSSHESDAVPVYGADATLVLADGEKLAWPEPELDYVNQMSVSWLPTLQRWVMFYGGDVPAFLIADPSTGHVPEQVHPPKSPGAIHMRASTHPWGRMTAKRSLDEGWSSAEPVLTRNAAAKYLACGDGGQDELPGCITEGDPHGPLDLLFTLAQSAFEPARDQPDDIVGKCLGGEVAMSVQQSASGNRIGRLYGVNIIDSWTEDVSERATDLASDERAVEVYWNVSTWNPYQVVLVKTQLRAPAPATQ